MEPMGNYPIIIYLKLYISLVHSPTASLILKPCSAELPSVSCIDHNNYYEMWNADTSDRGIRMVVVE